MCLLSNTRADYQTSPFFFYISSVEILNSLNPQFKHIPWFMTLLLLTPRKMVLELEFSIFITYVQVLSEVSEVDFKNQKSLKRSIQTHLLVTYLDISSSKSRNFFSGQSLLLGKLLFLHFVIFC